MAPSGKRPRSPEPEEPTFHATLTKRLRFASPVPPSPEPAPQTEETQPLGEEKASGAEQTQASENKNKKKSRRAGKQNRKGNGHEATAEAASTDEVKEENISGVEGEGDTKTYPTTKYSRRLRAVVNALKVEVQALKKSQEAEIEQRKKDADEMKGMLRELKDRFVQE